MLNSGQIAFINRNFRIVLIQKPKNILIGAGSLKNHIPEKALFKLADELFHTLEDKHTYWNRKDVKIKFYAK